LNFAYSYIFTGSKLFNFSSTIFLLLLAVLFLPKKEGFAQQNDTTPDKVDSLEKRRTLPSFLLWDNLNTSPLYPNQNPFLKRESPFVLPPPSTQRIEVEVDSTFHYRITDKLDSGAVGPGYTYDFEDFSKIQELRLRQEYWRNRSRGMDGESAVSGRGLIPPITLSPSFDRIFGGNEINIIPTGNVNLDFGNKTGASILINRSK
jgi:hypothetical protein